VRASMKRVGTTGQSGCEEGYKRPVDKGKEGQGGTESKQI
jgi:hypothetical protein